MIGSAGSRIALCPAAPSWATSMQLTSHERCPMWCHARTSMAALATRQVSARQHMVATAGQLALHQEGWCKQFYDRPVCAGNESHAGQVFCCVGALALAGALEQLDRDLLAWWWAPCLSSFELCHCPLTSARPSCPRLLQTGSLREVAGPASLCHARCAGCASARPRAGGSMGGRRSCRMCATPGGACLRWRSWTGCTGSTATRCAPSSCSVRSYLS